MIGETKDGCHMTKLEVMLRRKLRDARLELLLALSVSTVSLPTATMFSMKSLLNAPSTSSTSLALTPANSATMTRASAPPTPTASTSLPSATSPDNCRGDNLDLSKSAFQALEYLGMGIISETWE